MRVIFALLFCVSLSACTGLPKGIEPVGGFEVDNYLGKWFEIARFDHRYERGLEAVSAEYSLRDDGGLVVKNRGYETSKEAWKEAIGKAYFKDAADVGHLKVSFFGPFYGSYVIFELDKPDYQYAFVTSYNRKSLWFLSRSPVVSDALYDQFLSRIDTLGFDSTGLIRVDQKRNQ